MQGNITFNKTLRRTIKLQPITRCHLSFLSSNYSVTFPMLPSSKLPQTSSCLFPTTMNFCKEKSARKFPSVIFRLTSSFNNKTPHQGFK